MSVVKVTYRPIESVTLLPPRLAKLYMRWLWIDKYSRECWPCVRKRMKKHKEAVRWQLRVEIEKHYPELLAEGVDRVLWRISMLEGPVGGGRMWKAVTDNQFEKLAREQNPVLIIEGDEVTVHG